VEKELRRQLREAALDDEAFQMPLRVCDLSECRATCCHDGVFVDAEQAREIEAVVEEWRQAGRWSGDWKESRGKRVKTATARVAADALAADFPAHFPPTRCVFLDERHRCRLQTHAVDVGRSPWWWKPVSCWMHPLLLRAERGRPLLTLARPGRDPAAGPDYPGFGSCTPCGRSCAGQPPAWQTLRPELELLGTIAGRDLLAELQA
jgi:hypothetical protein